MNQLDNTNSRFMHSEFETHQATKVVGKKSAYGTQRNKDGLTRQEPLFF